MQRNFQGGVGVLGRGVPQEENALLGKIAKFGISLAIFFLIIVIFKVFLVTTLDPNSYGILRNVLTGTIHGSNVVRGGMHFTGLFYEYIEFPATLQTVEYSLDPLADSGPVKSRTGADPLDPDSGGQPISLSVSFQFKYSPEKLEDLYLTYGSVDNSKLRILSLGSNEVSNLSQKFTPQDFWTKRDVIAVRFEQGMNATLSKLCFVNVRFLQILRVEFAQKFEDTITQIQVAENLKIVNEYRQKVQEVVQSIRTMEAENVAMTKNITASGTAEATRIRAGAKRDVFNLKQTTKAKAYESLREDLRFSHADMMRYFQIKSLQSQKHLTVGVDDFTP